MDPQQELFTELKIMIAELGYDVYDGFLPPEGTPYPFVYLGDSNASDEPNKSAIFGIVTQTIHVWHDDPMERGTVSAMLLKLKSAARRLEHTKNFGWNVTGMNQRIIPDNTTGRPLLHGVIDLRFHFC